MPFLAGLKRLCDGEICVQRKTTHFDVETIITQWLRGKKEKE